MATAVKLDTAIVKSGYLIKLPKDSGSNWQKRYFILNGNTLTYYADHNSLAKAKGDLLLTAEASLEDTATQGRNYCITITTPFHKLVVAAKDNEERTAWRTALEDAITKAKNSIRGYVTKKGGLVEGTTRKFFILHDAAITWHQDHEHTSQIQGMIKLTSDTVLTLDSDGYRITLTDRSSNSTLALRFDNNVQDFEMWKIGISKILNKFAAVEQATVKRIENAYEKAIKRGKLKMRPISGGENWDEYYFVLTNSEVLVMEKNAEGQMEVFDMYEIQPNCSVFETSLGPFAFELVTPEKILHVLSDSRESTTSWIQAIRGAISTSKPNENDPLLAAALLRLEEDNFYDVSFHEDKPLGVVLERSGDWAVVKLSNVRDTGVSIGSALTSINGERVILKPYSYTINKLKNWRPPLHLGFRRAPRKTGFLVKLARQRRGTNTKNWKRRFFILEEGRLIYKDTDSPESPVKGDVPLMGSAVSLVSSTEAGKFFCFRLVSGVTSLTMQAETMDEMMDWGSMLYHAIAIANGGAHILGIERKREAEEEARIKAREEALAAKAAAEKAKAEAEAREKAEREAKIKAAEEEAIRRAALAEAERLALEAADRKARIIDDANSLLLSAIASRDISTLNTALSTVNSNEFVHEVPSLGEASVLLAQLSKEELDRVTSIQNLTVQLNSASIHDFSGLIIAISEAESHRVDEEHIVPARSKLRSLIQEKAVIEEVQQTLNNAILIENITSLESALEIAASVNYGGSEVSNAENLLSKLVEAEKQRVEEENARLAAEAAALDAEMAAAAAALSVSEESFKSDVSATEISIDMQDEDEDSEEEFESAKIEHATSAASAGSPNLVAKGSSSSNLRERTGRNLKSRKQRLEDEANRGVSHENGQLIVTDDDFHRLFFSYARVGQNGVHTINTMMFSTIWRMVTGEKGNLFKEMQSFQKFDAQNEGALNVDNFTNGWKELASKPGGIEIVNKIKNLTGADNVML